MATLHLLNEHGHTRCGVSPWENGANVTSDEALVSCGSGCLAVYPPPFGYVLPHDLAMKVMEAAKPRDVMVQFPLGGGDLTTVLDYRPVQGPLPESRTTCSGCFNEVRPGVRTDHATGCPTGQNGTPNYE